jgi:hypothetical protein
MSRKELLNEKRTIEEMIKKCEKKLREIDSIGIELNDSFVPHQYEEPMPLYYNKITHKNLNKEKSIKYTKMLINRLKNRSKKNYENITIKKEVTEEIEIPSFDEGHSSRILSPNGSIDDMPPLEYDDMPPLEYA